MLRAGPRHALAASALHCSSDLISSVLVLLDLAAPGAGCPHADSLAAIGLAGSIAVAGYRLGRATIDALVDRAPDGLTDAIRPLVAQTPGVAGREAIRSHPRRADRRRAHRFGAPHAATLRSAAFSGRADRPDQTGWLLRMNSPGQGDRSDKRTGRLQGGRALSADPLEPH
jgi:hypothetical protein